MLPMAMHDEGDHPFAGDARHALAAIIDRLAARGLTAVTATELEFYLIDDSSGRFQPPVNPTTGRRSWGAATLSMQVMDTFNPFFDALYAGCEALGIDAETATSEAGPGQFEINLNHGADPMRMADDTWLFKLLVRRLARAHGFAASFHGQSLTPTHRAAGCMSMPRCWTATGAIYSMMARRAGRMRCGMPLVGCWRRWRMRRLSLPPMRAAMIGWCRAPMRPPALAGPMKTAPHRSGCPMARPAARRLEHRVPGGDTNPYLVLAAILGGMELGLADQIAPAAPADRQCLCAESAPDPCRLGGCGRTLCRV